METAVASVTDLGVQDGEFDVALCQQGMPFFPDRPAAAREIHRVLCPGGVFAIAVWTPGHDILPFGVMNAALHDLGAPEPFPHAYDESSYVLTPEQVADLLADAGFHDVDSREVELLTHWPDPDAMYRGVGGTPFGAHLETLDDAQQARARELMAERTARFVVDGRLAIPTYSVIARAVA
ncbi:MAG: methyltransferase domain-containing protein [Jatrophihabitantaceae bacterium]